MSRTMDDVAECFKGSKYNAQNEWHQTINGIDVVEGHTHRRYENGHWIHIQRQVLLRNGIVLMSDRICRFQRIGSPLCRICDLSINLDFDDDDERSLGILLRAANCEALRKGEPVSDFESRVIQAVLQPGENE